MEMNSMWQPSARTPWPDRVNEELSRHGAGLEDHERQIETLVIRPEEHIRIIYGLEDHERQIETLTERIQSLERIITQLCKEIHKIKSGD